MGRIKYWLIVGFIILFAIFYIAISDRDSTLSRLKSAGENGDVEAQYALGLMYSENIAAYVGLDVHKAP